MPKFRKKPVVIEAVRWNAPDEMGRVKLARECDDHPAVRMTSYMEVNELIGTSGCSRDCVMWDWSVLGLIESPEGKQIVRPGDWIIKGVAGEFYPCKPEVFESTYEKVEESTTAPLSAPERPTKRGGGK